MLFLNIDSYPEILELVCLTSSFFLKNSSRRYTPTTIRSLGTLVGGAVLSSNDVTLRPELFSCHEMIPAITWRFFAEVFH